MAKTAQKKTADKDSKPKKAKAAASDKKVVKVKAARKAAPADLTGHAGKVCKMTGCKREYKAKGYCVSHYKKWRQGELGKKRYKACKDFNCFKPMALNRHGFCEEHFQNYYVKGMEQARIVAD